MTLHPENTDHIRLRSDFTPSYSGEQFLV